MKRCSKCKRQLKIESFSNNKKSLDGKDWHCRKCKSGTTKAWKQNNGGADVLRRMYRYGLTREEVEAYLQIPSCQICRKPFECDADVHIDHCHQHGTIRGVLCNICNNTLLGTTAECIVRNERANDYLLRSMEVRLESARAG